MTYRDIKPENCPLCRRPKWNGRGNSPPFSCGADANLATATDYAVYLRDCRTHALRVAALVAPVVEAIDAWASEDEITTFDAVDRALDAMRDGLAKLGGG